MKQQFRHNVFYNFTKHEMSGLPDEAVNMLASHTGGNIVFHNENILSPVGNRVRSVNVKTNESFVFDFQARKNVESILISPDNFFLIAIDVEGHAIVASLAKRNEIHRMNFKAPVLGAAFSPDSRYLAVTHKFHVQVWRAPPHLPCMQPFSIHHVHNTSHITRCVAWSDDGQRLAVGSGPEVAVFTLQTEEGAGKALLTGHRDNIIAAAFGQDGTLYSASRDGAVYSWAESTPEDIEDGSRPMGRGSNQWIRLDKELYYDHKVDMTSWALQNGIMVAGFDDGAFQIHETPSLDHVHTLGLSSAVSAAAVSPTGEWVAVASALTAQILVWDWAAEAYLTRQGGHQGAVTAVAHNRAGTRVATAGEDGRVIVWDSRRGAVVGTFTDHTAAVTGMTFTPTDALITVSIDGTARAFDVGKLRAFRTMDLMGRRGSAVCVDNGGELIAVGTEAGAVLMFSLRTGQLMDTLQQHEAFVTGVTFVPGDNVLVSTSWDHTAVVWDVFERNGAVETLEHERDVTAVAASPHGDEVVTATSDGCLSFWDWKEGSTRAVIDGRRDVAGGRSVHDRRAVTNTAQGQHFTHVAYTADGNHVVAGGDSKWLCVYDRRLLKLVKKVQITLNRSLDGVLDRLNSSDMTETGPKSLISTDDPNAPRMAAKQADRAEQASSRKTLPAARVTALSLAATGAEWVVGTEEGPIVFRPHASVAFDPLDVELDVTAGKARALLASGDAGRALMMAVKLGATDIMVHAVRAVPAAGVRAVAAGVAAVYLPRVVNLIAFMLETEEELEALTGWAEALLYGHTDALQAQAGVQAPLRRLQKAMDQRLRYLGDVANENRHRMMYLAGEKLAIDEEAEEKEDGVEWRM